MSVDAREVYRGADGATARATLEVSVSIRTILLVAGVVASRGRWRRSRASFSSSSSPSSASPCSRRW